MNRNEGLGWDPLLKNCHNPGGDCYWVGGSSNTLYIPLKQRKEEFRPCCKCSHRITWQAGRLSTATSFATIVEVFPHTF